MAVLSVEVATAGLDHPLAHRAPQLHLVLCVALELMNDSEAALLARAPLWAMVTDYASEEA